MVNLRFFGSDGSRVFLGIPFSAKEFWGRNPKRHNSELSKIIFDYKHVWVAWAEGFYYGKCTYYVLVN